MDDHEMEWYPQGSPDPRRHFTPYPNFLLDVVMRLRKPSEMMVLNCLVRKVFGYHKERDGDMVSYAQIMEMTGLGRSTVIEAVKVLVAINLVDVKRTVTSYRDAAPNVYRLKLDSDGGSPESGTLPDDGYTENRTTLSRIQNVPDSGPTKERNKEANADFSDETKENDSKKETPTSSYSGFATLIPDQAPPSQKSDETMSIDWERSHYDDLFETGEAILVNEPSEPMASPGEIQSQQAPIPPNPAKPWLTRRVKDAPQTTIASRRTRQTAKPTQHTGARKSAPRIEPGEGLKRPNKYGEVIDAIRAAGIAYVPSSRDAGAVKKSGADAATIAAAYIAAYRREWGGNGVQGNLSLWYVCDRINDYTAWVMQGRPKATTPGNGGYAKGSPQQGRPGDQYRMLGKLAPSEYENIQRMREREQKIKAEIAAELAAEDAAKGIPGERRV